jgi:hypothetical protein
VSDANGGQKEEKISRDQDGAWKEILNEMFAEMLQLFFPKYYNAIDWSVPPQFLDSELQTLTSLSDETLRLADKLARVKLKNGNDQYLLLHVEIQGYSDDKFARRMFVYYYRLFDKYEEQITSLAVLTRPGSGQAPSVYRSRFLDGLLIYKFPMVKVWELRAQMEELRQSQNPFAHLMLAQLSDIYDQTQQQRYSSKLRILRDAVDMGFDRKIMIQLFKLTDWLLRLPKNLELQLSQVLTQERGGKVDYKTSWEEIAEERGLEQGQRTALVRMNLRQLNAKLGNVPVQAEEAVSALPVTKLEQLGVDLLNFQTLQDLQNWLTINNN